MADGIFVPPAAPTTRRTLPMESITIVGDIDDSGCFPGLIIFAGEPGRPKKFLNSEDEKSSIPLFRNIPVLFEVTPAPKLKFALL